jgi:KAP family P-loop domain
MSHSLRVDNSVPRVKRLKELPLEPKLFRSDAPPTDLEEGRDAFGHKAYATAIASALIEAEPPYTFGLFGPFGLGKTTVIEEVRRQLREQAAVVVFDAWRYEGDTLRRHFLRDSAQQLIEDGQLPRNFVEENLTELDSSRVTPGRQRFGGLDKAEMTSLALRLPIIVILIWLAWQATPRLSRELGHDEIVKLGLTIIIALATLVLVPMSRVVRVVTESVTHGELKPELFAQKFSDLIAHIKSDRLVVVIDNLDRCSATRIEEIFFTLSTFLEPVGKPKNRRRIAIVRPRKRKDAVFLLAADAEALRRHLEARELKASRGAEAGKRLREDTGRYAGDYLRKIIKASITMKPLLADDMREYVAAQLGDFAAKRKLEDQDTVQLVELTTAALRQNPRRVKEFAGNLELQLRVVEARQVARAIAPPISDDVLLAAKVQLLQEEWPESFAALEADDRLLDAWHASIPRGETQHIPDGAEPRFQAFMNIGQGISNRNLRAFLRLKQSRAEVELPRYPEFYDALVGGRTNAVDEIVGAAAGGDAFAYAKQMPIILREELRRGYLAGARNVVQVVTSSSSLRGHPDSLRRTLSLAADSNTLRPTLRAVSPGPLLEVGRENLDSARLDLLVEPFVRINEIYTDSPEQALAALEALLGLGSALSKSRRYELSAGLRDAGAGSAFDLYAVLADRAPELIPSSTGEKAVAVLGDLDTGSPAFQAFQGWLRRENPSQEPQDTFLGLVSQRITATFASGVVSDVDAERPWLAETHETLALVKAATESAADNLVTVVSSEIQRGVAAGLEDEMLDVLDATFRLSTKAIAETHVDQVLEAYEGSSRERFLDYVDERAERWIDTNGFGWRVQLRLLEIIRDVTQPEEVMLRAARLNARIDASDREEVIGGRIPELVSQGSFRRSQLLKDAFPESAKTHAKSTRTKTLERLDQEVPEISEDAFDFTNDLLGDFDESDIGRLQTVLAAQVERGDQDDAEEALAAADRFADSRSDFAAQRDALLRDLFDRIASAEVPPDDLPRLLALRSVSLDRDRRASLVAQLTRWVRNPGPHQNHVAEAIAVFADPSAEQRFEFVEALVEAETASIGNVELRQSLLEAAIAVQGRKGSKAANRIADRLKALKREKTEENADLLGRLDRS